MDAHLRYNSMVYALRPVPRVGRIDSSAVFLSREMLQKESLFFSEYRSYSPMSLRIYANTMMP